MTEEQLIAFYTANPTAIEAKFNGDASAAAKSMVSLQGAFTKTTQELAALKAKAATPTPPAPPTGLRIPEPTPTNAHTAAWDQFETEYRTNGDVSPETKQRLLDLGIPERFIETARATATYAAQQRVNAAAAEVGGKENLDAILKYAQTLPEAQRREIDKGLNGDAWQYVLRGLAQAREGSKANEPNRSVLPTGANAGSGGKMKFDTYDQMMGAMRDPRFKSDKGFREAVIAAGQAVGRK